MTAIEEMYKAYGVESGYTYCGLSRDRGYLTCKYPRKQLYEDCSFALCDKCEYKRKSFHPFTAEKQLELIKLIAKSCRGFGLFSYKPVWECGANFSWETFDTTEDDIDFAKALVKLAISLKDELDHAKVKEILE